MRSLGLFLSFLVVAAICVSSVAAQTYELEVTAQDPAPVTGAEETDVINAWDNELAVQIIFNGTITTVVADAADSTWTLTSTVVDASTTARAAMDALETRSADWDTLENAVFDDTATNFTLNMTTIAAADPSGDGGDGDGDDDEDNAIVPAIVGSIAGVAVICFALVMLVVIVVAVVLLIVVIAVILVMALNKGGGGGGKSGEDPWYNDSSDLYEDSL